MAVVADVGGHSLKFLFSEAPKKTPNSLPSSTWTDASPDRGFKWEDFDAKAESALALGLVQAARSLCLTPSDHNLLLAVPPDASLQTREKAAKVCFETLGFYSVSMMDSPYLALLTTGGDTGSVLDVGYTSSRFTSYVAGVFCGDEQGGVGNTLSGTGRSHLGTRHLEKHLDSVIDWGSSDVTVKTRATWLDGLLRHCTKIPPKDSFGPGDSEKKIYHLPDNAEISVPSSVGEVLGEGLFRPSLLTPEGTTQGVKGSWRRGQALPGLGQLARNGIWSYRAATTPSLTQDWQEGALRGETVLCGGGCAFSGFAERIAQEAGVELNGPGGEACLGRVCTGGMLMACLSSYPATCISHPTYLEQGPRALIHRLK